MTVGGSRVPRAGWCRDCSLSANTFSLPGLRRPGAAARPRVSGGAIGLARRDPLLCCTLAVPLAAAHDQSARARLAGRRVQRCRPCRGMSAGAESRRPRGLAAAGALLPRTSVSRCRHRPRWAAPVLAFGVGSRADDAPAFSSPSPGCPSCGFGRWPPVAAVPSRRASAFRRAISAWRATCRRRRPCLPRVIGSSRRRR